MQQHRTAGCLKGLWESLNAALLLHKYDLCSPRSAGWIKKKKNVDIAPSALLGTKFLKCFITFKSLEISGQNIFLNA